MHHNSQKAGLEKISIAFPEFVLAFKKRREAYAGGKPGYRYYEKTI